MNDVCICKSRVFYGAYEVTTQDVEDPFPRSFGLSTAVLDADKYRAYRVRPCTACFQRRVVFVPKPICCMLVKDPPSHVTESLAHRYYGPSHT